MLRRYLVRPLFAPGGACLTLTPSLSLNGPSALTPPGMRPPLLRAGRNNGGPCRGYCSSRDVTARLCAVFHGRSSVSSGLKRFPLHAAEGGALDWRRTLEIEQPACARGCRFYPGAVVRRVSFHRFKQFKDQAFELHPGVSLLGGGNNAGKSTILHGLAVWEFCRTAIEMERGPETFVAGQGGQGLGLGDDEFSPINVPSLKHLWTNLKTQKDKEPDGYTLKIRGEWQDNASNRHLEFGLSLANDRLFVKTTSSNLAAGDLTPRVAYGTRVPARPRRARAARGSPPGCGGRPGSRRSRFASPRRGARAGPRAPRGALIGGDSAGGARAGLAHVVDEAGRSARCPALPGPSSRPRSTPTPHDADPRAGAA